MILGVPNKVIFGNHRDNTNTCTTFRNCQQYTQGRLQYFQTQGLIKTRV